MARKARELPRRRRDYDDEEEREHAQLRKELQEELRRARELEARQFRPLPQFDSRAQ